MLLSCRYAVAVLCLVCIWVGGGCVDDEVARVPTRGDAEAMARLLVDSQRVSDELIAGKAMFDRSADAPLTPDERAWLLPLWASFIDHDLAFLSYRELFLTGWRNAEQKDKRLMALTVGMAAHVGLLRARLQLIDLCDRNDAIIAALDEANGEHGVAAGHLSRISIEAARPHAILMLEIGLERLNTRADLFDDSDDPLLQLFAKVRDRVAEVGAHTVALYNRTYSLLGKISIGLLFEKGFDGLVDPLATDIALWLGDTRLRSSDAHLISQAQLDALQPTLQPGDIIVERRNWYLSNLGLPGFWPHSALYIGSPAELAAAFDDLPEVRALMPEGLTARLAEKYPKAWASYVAVAADGHDSQPNRVIEAVSDGVVFTTLSHSCLADYVGIFRPRLSALDKARAIDRSLSHWGKPYDFDFDFLTESKLVCSELVWASYQTPANQGTPLKLPLSEVMGRMTLPPNDIVRMFDSEEGKPGQQLDFVAFLDGVQAKGAAIVADKEALRASWRRPKWDILQQ